MEITGNIADFLGLNDLQGRGTLSYVDTKNIKEVVRIVEQELFCFPFEIVAETGEIKYAQILFGYRDSQRYIFKIDSRNSFNQEIKKHLPHLPVKNLIISGQTFSFYFILSPEELVIFISTFSKWVEEKNKNNNF